jgi:leucyl-tRNA synthetase
MAPTTPHIADELWAQLGHADSIMLAPWPVFRPELTVESEIEYPVQVGGKVRGRFSMPADASEDAVREAALSNADVMRFLEGKQIRKVIVVPGKMVNVVAN